MTGCDPDGPLLVHTVKNYATADATSFTVLGRVISGTLFAGMDVRPVIYSLPIERFGNEVSVPYDLL